MQIALVLVSSLAVGCGEVALSRLLIRALLAGNGAQAAVYLPLKAVLLAAVLVPTVLFAPQLLWLAGCAVALPLVAGGAAAGLKSLHSKKEVDR